MKTVYAFEAAAVIDGKNFGAGTTITVDGPDGVDPAKLVNAISRNLATVVPPAPPVPPAEVNVTAPAVG